MKLKSTLRGDRIVLKRTTPSKAWAKKMFALIDKNREHLRPWFPWVDKTMALEDTIEYLQRKEVEFEANQKVEYGIIIDGKYIGNISMFGISWYDKRGEIGYWIEAAAQGNGYVTEAVQVLEKHFFEVHDFHRISIRCNILNLASARVAEKCRYMLEGRFREASFSTHFGQHYDVLAFGKLKKDCYGDTSKSPLLHVWIENKMKKHCEHKNSLTRILHILEGALSHRGDSIIDLYDLSKLSKAQVLKMRNMGKKSGELLFSLLEEDGISLKE